MSVDRRKNQLANRGKLPSVVLTLVGVRLSLYSYGRVSKLSYRYIE